MFNSINSNDNQKEIPKKSRKALLIMGCLVILGVMGLAIEIKWITNELLKLLIEHISIALIVASVLGATYEYFLHQEKERLLRSLLEESRTKVFNALDAYGILTPKGIFGLLHDIAIQTTQIPTLYQPAREHAKEYTFAENMDYFDTLIEVRRQDIVNIMESWIEPSTPINVKFLASDFIGEYYLKELAPRLMSQIDPILHGGNLDEKNTYWVLNYLWAASRCEEHKYKTLSNVLCHCNDDKIEEWIVFVPVQMPSKELGEMIEVYLSLEKSISVSILELIVRAAASLERKKCFDGGALLKKYDKKFEKLDVNKIRRIWANYALPDSMIENLGKSVSKPNKAN